MALTSAAGHLQTFCGVATYVRYGSRLCKNVGRLAWDFEILDFRSFAGPVFGFLIFGV
jgi:hypothetical protein